MAIDMRHTKLKREEAALLSGELKKPSWESRNEGIHERVSFEDTIWGFDLAGGSYYKTPLRVTAVKKNSRADKAGIRPGDRLKRINDIETSTLTIQEAHQIILDSGVHLKIAVTAPEDEEDAYYCYEDPTLDDGYDSEEERRRAEEKRKKMEVHARVSHYWSLQWPWVSKRRIIYRESNCFLVPSKFEEKNKSKFPTQPMLKTPGDIVLDSVKSERELKDQKDANTIPKTPIQNGAPAEISKTSETPITYGVVPEVNENKAGNTTVSNGPIPEVNEGKVDTTPMTNGGSKAPPAFNRLLSEVPETKEPSNEEEINSTLEDLTEDISQIDEEMESKADISVEESYIENEMESKDLSQNDISVEESHIESESAELDSEMLENSQQDESMDTKDETVEDNDDDLQNKVLEDESLPKGEEESIIESILSDGDEQINHSDER